jgi:Flp pilus assembly protein TadG
MMSVKRFSPISVRDAKPREGQSLVELALAVPLLLLIMLGTIDIGRAFFDYVDMRNAAREGASYYAKNPTDSAGAVLRVKNHGVPSDVAVSVVCENGSCTTINGTGRVRVTVSRTFKPVTTGFLSTFGLGSFNLSASATMRVMT